MLTLILIVLVILFFAGGLGVRGHPTYGSYSGGGIGLGAVLLIILLLILVGAIHI